MPRLPKIADFMPDLQGWGYFLCTQKEVRSGRNGDFLAVMLQDVSGQIQARVFDDVARLRGAFDSGEFVRAEGRVSLYQQQTQFTIAQIRRVDPAVDAAQGFSESACVPSASRAPEEMWAELQALIAGIRTAPLRVLLARMAQDHERQLREWPAAQQVHHAYRGGFLEHILQMALVGRSVARAYGANDDLVVAGAILHDIGKLQELSYESGSTSYTRDGNLVGHIALGLVMVRDAIRGISDFPDDLRAQLEHLIVSHHGLLEHGSPVEPKSIEAFILSAVDGLDATINQVRRAWREPGGDGEFTGWHRRLGRVLYRGTAS